MKNKLMSLFITVFAVFGILSGISYADSVEFYNAETKTVISEACDEENVYAMVSFVAPKDGTATFLQAKYEATGKLKSVSIIGTASMVSGETVEYKTDSIVMDEFATLKLFAWDSIGGMKPLLNGAGELERVSQTLYTKVTKFEQKEGSADLCIMNETVKIGDIFEAVEGVAPEVDTDNVHIFVSPADGSEANAVYTRNTEDWREGTLAFSGLGDLEITIRDYYFCIPTTIKVTVKEPEWVNKFVPKEELTFTHTIESNVVTKTLGDLFEVVEGAEIGTVTATLNGQECAVDAEDWTKSVIEFAGAGTYTVVIKDDYDYCNETTAIVTIVEPDPIVKFEAKQGLRYEHTRVDETVTVKLGDLFTNVADIVSTDLAITANSENVTCTIDNTNWANSDVYFEGAGTYEVTVTDNNYCKDAVATVEITKPAKVDKFTANNLTVTHETENGTEVKLGEIFSVAENETIDSTKVTVATDAAYVANTSDWTQSTISFVGEGTVTVTISEDEYCKPATATVEFKEPEDAEKFALVFENTDKYLYRVGKVNAVSLGSLFKAKDGATVGNIPEDKVKIEKLDAATNVSGTYTPSSTWTAGTIKFEGTGPVEVTIDDDAYAKPLTLNLEVVDATNVTAYEELKNQNSVLLNDITMSSDSSYALSNATLYGNGFTFDVTQGAYTSSGYLSGNYLVSLNNANLDNVKIVGAVYTQYGATRNDDYNRAAIFSTGNNTIANSYISNCASPVRLNDGNLEIINSTLKGGNFANLDIRGGNVVLDNVTTINQVNGNDLADDGTVVAGFGIVVYYENVLNTTTIEIRNGITQYNYLSYAQAKEHLQDDKVKSILNIMYGNDCADVQYKDDKDDIWVNAGILSMTGEVGDDNITDIDGYSEISPSMLGTTGYLHTKIPTAESIAESVAAYATSGQYAIAPSYSFDYTTKNYVAKTDGSNDYCYEENGIVNISMDEGDTFNWDTSILTATKHGQTLDYTVSMNGVDYTGKSIPFDEKGDYEVIYTYIDNYNYGADGKNIYPVTYTKTVNITVSVIEDTTKRAEFTFGSSGQATEKITIGNNTYISATGVSHNNSTWSYITVDGTKIYYPIVEATIVSKKTAYFNVFKNVVTITDYPDGGEVTYNSSTKTMPSGLTVEKGIYKPFADISSNWSTLNDIDLTYVGASKVFKYAGSSDASSTPTTYNSALCFKSPDVSNARDEYITIAQYSYTDSTNTTYYYYVGYHMAAKGDGCLAEGTLITLADGSQKKVEEITYDDELLAWNFFDGEYATVPATLIMDDGKDDYTVISLSFDDGTELRIIDVHGIYDADLNQFVYIDPENVSEYVGHNFIKTVIDENGVPSNATVKLVDFDVTTEHTGCYTIQTAKYVTCIADGMLTQTPPLVDGYFDYFEMGEGMKYDEELMQADIEKYGLYTYDDFADYLSYEAFIAFNGPYLKVAVEKGYFTYDYLIKQIAAFGVGN